MLTAAGARAQVPRAGRAQPRHKLLVVSIDGLDWRYLRDRDREGERIPNLRKLLAEGAYADGVTGVWPTITWPSHTTLITGVRPDQHGILGNRKPKSEGGDYYWSAHLIRTPTLLTCAAAAHLTTAAVTWPVTVDAPLTWNLPEFFARRNGGSMDMASIASKSVPADLIEQISRDEPSFPQQWMDDRTRALAAVWLLKHKQPDLLLVHLVDLDSDQHDLGPFNETSRATLERSDALLGDMMAAMPPDYDVAVVSDHGFERVDAVAHLPVLLRQHGITGKVDSFGGLAVTSDAEAARFLQAESEAGKDGIGPIVSREDLLRYAPTLGSALLAIEPPEHFMFAYGAAFEEAQTPFLTPPAEKGDHGFWPVRGDYASVYLLYGPGVPPGEQKRMEATSIKERLSEAFGLRCDP